MKKYNKKARLQYVYTNIIRTHYDTIIIIIIIVYKRTKTKTAIQINNDRNVQGTRVSLESTILSFKKMPSEKATFYIHFRINIIFHVNCTYKN